MKLTGVISNGIHTLFSPSATLKHTVTFYGKSPELSPTNSPVDDKDFSCKIIDDYEQAVRYDKSLALKN